LAGIYKYNIQPFLAHPLNRNRKIKSIIRFLKWQFILRVANKNKAWLMVMHECGFRVIVKKGQTGMTGNLYSGLHEFEEMMFVIHYVREQDIFFDIGANVGIYTLLVANLKKARSYCFEPIPSTFYFLRLNMIVNNLENSVTCYNKGVGDETATLSFVSDKDSMNKVLTTEYNGEVIQAEIVKLDDFFENNPVNNYSMLKIDTEGYEYNVLKGANSIISDSRVKVILVEMNEAEKIHQLLSGKGFVACTYNPFTRQLNETDYLSKANIIYVKDLLFVRNRLHTAEKFCIRGYEF
jgi:FkbM family methyltransferase